MYFQVIEAFGKACGKKIPYEIKPRRAGDIATCYCDPSKAKRELGWEAEYGIDEMCADSWKWQTQNPNGYNDPNKFGTGETRNETGVGMLFRQFGQYFKGQNACLGESQSAGCGDYCIIIGWTG